MYLHICLVFQIERHHVEEHVERLIDEAGHQKHQCNSLALVIDPDGGESTDKGCLAADEAEDLPFFMAEAGAEDPDRDQRDCVVETNVSFLVAQREKEREKTRKVSPQVASVVRFA